MTDKRPNVAMADGVVSQPSAGVGFGTNPKPPSRPSSSSSGSSTPSSIAGGMTPTAQSSPAYSILSRTSDPSAPVGTPSTSSSSASRPSSGSSSGSNGSTSSSVSRLSSGSSSSSSGGSSSGGSSGSSASSGSSSVSSPRRPDSPYAPDYKTDAPNYMLQTSYVEMPVKGTDQRIKLEYDPYKGTIKGTDISPSDLSFSKGYGSGGDVVFVEYKGKVVDVVKASDVLYKPQTPTMRVSYTPEQIEGFKQSFESNANELRLAIEKGDFQRARDIATKLEFMGAKGITAEVQKLEEQSKELKGMQSALQAGRLQEAREFAKAIDIKYGTNYSSQLDKEIKKYEYAKSLTEKINKFVEEGNYKKAEKGINILKGLGYITPEEADRLKAESYILTNVNTAVKEKDLEKAYAWLKVYDKEFGTTLSKDLGKELELNEQRSRFYEYKIYEVEKRLEEARKTGNIQKYEEALVVAKGLGTKVEENIRTEMNQVKELKDINRLIEERKFKEAYEKARDFDKKYGTQIASQLQPYTVEFHPITPQAQFARGIRDAIPFGEYFIHAGKQEFVGLGDVAKTLGAKNTEPLNVVGVAVPTKTDVASPYYWAGRVIGEVGTGFVIGKAIATVARPLSKVVKEAIKEQPAKYELTTKGLQRLDRPQLQVEQKVKTEVELKPPSELAVKAIKAYDTAEWLVKQKVADLGKKIKEGLPDIKTPESLEKLARKIDVSYKVTTFKVSEKLTGLKTEVADFMKSLEKPKEYKPSKRVDFSRDIVEPEQKPTPKTKTDDPMNAINIAKRDLEALTMREEARPATKPKKKVIYTDLVHLAYPEGVDVDKYAPIKTEQVQGNKVVIMPLDIAITKDFMEMYNKMTLTTLPALEPKVKITTESIPKVNVKDITGLRNRPLTLSEKIYDFTKVSPKLLIDPFVTPKIEPTLTLTTNVQPIQQRRVDFAFTLDTSLKMDEPERQMPPKSKPRIDLPRQPRKDELKSLMKVTKLGRRGTEVLF